MIALLWAVQSESAKPASSYESNHRLGTPNSHCERASLRLLDSGASHHLAARNLSILKFRVCTKSLTIWIIGIIKGLYRDYRESIGLILG